LFIGREILVRLLEAGHCPVLLVRGDSSVHAVERIRRAMETVRPDQPGLADQCRVLTADLRAEGLGLSPALRRELAGSVDTVISVAACTSFDARPDGEPEASNVVGLGRLLTLAEEAGAAMHHFSTAFVCGDRSGCWSETEAEPGLHHNAYETSKWKGEQLLRQADGRGLSSLTIYRPSITVTTGEGPPMPAEHGISILVNSLRTAAKLIGRRQKSGEQGRVDLSRLRVDAGPQNPVHLVPVDWVADVFAHIFARPEFHGRNYHLALDRPPVVDQLRRAIEGYLNIGLGPYTDEDLWEGQSSSGSLETRFYRLARSLRHYCRQSMSFGSAHLDEALEGSGLAGIGFDDAWWPAIFQAIDGKPERKNDTERKTAGTNVRCGEYFESWLPEHVTHSSLGTLTALTVDVGFWIEGAGQWTLSFREGQLEQVERTASEERVCTGFRTGPDTFDEVVSGRLDPQQAFFTGRAEIVGDVEAGLKFAMILQEFVREFPWTGGTAAEA